jgi:hypothetical protein
MDGPKRLKVTDLTKFPRPACVHDPAGVLEICPACEQLGAKRVGVVIKEEKIRV